MGPMRGRRPGNPPSPHWGKWVREQRQRRGLLRNDLAEKAGINPSYISLIEAKFAVPSRTIVISIAEALEADVDEALIYAGFAPEHVHPKKLWALVAAVKSGVA